MKKLCFETQKNGTLALNEAIEKLMTENGWKNGVLTIFTPHTTAAVCLTSKWDPAGWEDIHNQLSQLVPSRIDYKHQYDTPADAAGHIKSVLVGASCCVIVEEGKMILGSSQGIFFLEFDGPRMREIWVKFSGEAL